METKQRKPAGRIVALHDMGDKLVPTAEQPPPNLRSEPELVRWLKKSSNVAGKYRFAKLIAGFELSRGTVETVDAKPLGD